MIEQPRSNEVIIQNLIDSPENAARGVRRGFHRFGKELVDRNRKLIRKGPKTGKLYRIPGRKRRHRASAPGEAPANLTGDLARSIGYEILSSGSEMAYGSRSEKDSKGGVPYGAWLDGGTKRIKPRPHVSRTATELEHRGEIILNEEILKLL